MTRVLITGAGGFLGRHITHYLHKRGYTVAGLGRFVKGIRPSQLKEGIDSYGMTLPDEALSRVLKDFSPDAVVHCASTASVPDSVNDPLMDFRGSVAVCAQTLDTIRKISPSTRFIFLSSAAVYGNPTNIPVPETASCAPISPYGFDKRMCELLVQEYSDIYGISSAVLRIFSAYGQFLQRQVIHDLCLKFSANEQIVDVLGTGNESRDFIHAWDVAQAVECIITSDATGIFNVASGEETSISKLIGLLGSLFANGKTIRFSGDVREGDPLRWQANIDRISLLGFNPSITLTDGLITYHRWFISRGGDIS